MNRRQGIEWKSKFVDLIIVIVGISIAFKLNTWHEDKLVRADEKAYLSSFYTEGMLNVEELAEVQKYSLSLKNDIDSLKSLLVSKKYKDPRIAVLSPQMMQFPSFKPITTTLDFIVSSGEFKYISEPLLRMEIVETYNSFEKTVKLEEILSEYISAFVMPVFFNKVQLSTGRLLEPGFYSKAEFENIVFGYDVLLTQLITSYGQSIEKARALNERLSKTKE